MCCGPLPWLEFEAVWLVSTEVGPVQRNARAWPDEDGYPSEDVETPSDQLAPDSGTQIAIVRPRNFRDAVTIGEYFRQEIPVIINLEDMSNAEAWRIIDFASGLILGLRGDIERISKRTFLIMPAGATILTVHNSLTDEGFFNQA
jgi:cell division inhibitor SepF